MTTVAKETTIHEKHVKEVKLEEGTQTDYDNQSDVGGDHVYGDLTEAEFKRLRWRLDLRIVPFCGLLYLCSFLDRSNIGNAKIAGITTDLNITDNEFNVALSIFFVGYIIFEIPANLMLKKIGPNLWIPLVMIAFFLGIGEAGLFPGVIFYLTLWYTRREQATRIAIFFGWATVAGAFGGVLAFGIMRMDGLRGLHGWQWIFLIEALPTLILAFITFFVLPGLPETSKVLTDTERRAIMERLRVDAGPATETHFSWVQFRSAFTDWKVYMHGFIYITGAIPLYSLSLFLPSIIKGMGFQDLNAQAMTAPPYVIACIVTIAVAMSADRRAERGYHIAAPSCLGLIGYILMVACKDQGSVALYISACVTVTGVFAQASPMLSWFTNNIGGHTKRAVASAIIISIGNVGGAIAGQVYRANDAPQMNKKRDNLSPEEYQKACEGEDLCDMHPRFRYIS
ncbi:major facilitator superfamily domain-containing protein [Dichotomocladium elegans]|nr:major facilitator superfamily domain-containing protein [Dichotomocladium elegans]